MISSKPKIFVVYSKSGVCYWRVWLPMEAMRKAGLIEVRYLDSRLMTPEVLKDNLKWCDIIHIQGLIGMDALDTMRRYQHLGIRVVTDYDDKLFDVSPFNPVYKDFGLEDVKVRDPLTGEEAYLWTDGENGFDIKRNAKKFMAMKDILREADVVTTTTLTLKQALAEISEVEDNIRVVPNAIDLTQWKPYPEIREKHKPGFRFGWAVSNSHREDWLFIGPILKEFLEKHPDATFVCIGDVGLTLKSLLPEAQLEWHPFSDLWEGHYPLRMSLLGLDCAIAPLADTEFNKCKSPLKWEEYTAFGWPVIAQKMEPYLSHIVSGETGLLAGTKDEWLNALESMYTDKDLRAKLLFNARFVLKEEFDLEKVAHEWYGVYNALILGVSLNA